jgi:predicted NUDIX family phosphoesterase
MSTDVGKVHFGVVHRLTFKELPTLKMDDPALTNGEWKDIVWLLRNVDKFEGWSNLVIKELL